MWPTWTESSLMAVTLTSLRARYPEFTDAPDALLTACITQAGNELSETSWGDNYDEGVLLLACIKAESSNHAHEMQAEEGGESSYMKEFKRLERRVGSAYRIPW